MILKEEVANRIKLRMNELGLKQKDIVETGDISKPAMSNYMNATRLPDTETIYKLSKILNTSIEWLLTGMDTNVNFLGENEKELLEHFNILPEREQIKLIGVVEEKAKAYRETSEKSSASRTG